MGRWAGAGALAWVALAASPAPAAWLKATTRHFVVYSDTDDAALRKQATDLEKFDAVLRHVQRVPDDPDAEFNKVTVYVLPTIEAVQQFSRQNNVAGFYFPRVTGSIAFTPRQGDGTEVGAMTPRIVLFHEYAHHFLLGSFPRAFPAWYSEGYAEFASTEFEKNGDFWVGAPAQHRAYSLLGGGQSLTTTQLFAPPAKMNDAQIAALYSRGWLLTHMIWFDKTLAPQFDRYLTLLNTGKPSVAAGTEAFGDLKALDRKLDAYLARSKMTALTIKGATLTADVAIRPLSPAEAALIRLRMASTRGVDARTAGPIFARAKAAAARVPADPVAQGWLAEMAYDAGDDAAAEAAADSALAADPASSQALLYKARVHLRRLVVAKSKDDSAWREARSWIIKANRAQNNDAAALWLFYTWHVAQGIQPSKGAIAGLYRASALVPQDTELRFAAARQRLLDGDVDQAKVLLRPLAYDPHAPSDNVAARLLAVLDGGAGQQAVLDALAKAAADAERNAAN